MAATRLTTTCLDEVLQTCKWISEDCQVPICLLSAGFQERMYSALQLSKKTLKWTKDNSGIVDVMPDVHGLYGLYLL